MEEKEMDVGKLCTKAKRIWGQSKREITQSDRLNKVESALFGADTTLAELVQLRDKIEQQIIDYIDSELVRIRDVKEGIEGMEEI